jgi:hypothetical protein
MPMLLAVVLINGTTVTVKVAHVRLCHSRMLLVRAYPRETQEMVFDRRFGPGETIYDPWHYVPVLARKPGALRNGARFKDWLLPASLERVRRKLKGSDDGDRQMAKVLSAVLGDGLTAVEAACAEALADGVLSPTSSSTSWRGGESLVQRRQS